MLKYIHLILIVMLTACNTKTQIVDSKSRRITVEHLINNVDEHVFFSSLELPKIKDFTINEEPDMAILYCDEQDHYCQKVISFLEQQQVKINLARSIKEKHKDVLFILSEKEASECDDDDNSLGCSMSNNIVNMADLRQL